MRTPQRNQFSDFEWPVIERLLPIKPHGVPRGDDRKVINEIY